MQEFLQHVTNFKIFYCIFLKKGVKGVTSALKALISAGFGVTPFVTPSVTPFLKCEKRSNILNVLHPLFN